MAFFRRLALRSFIKTHPPSRQVSPAPGELISAYQGILPDSLLELWRRKGLGFYGENQLALIDPRPWQAVLDRWIVSPPDAVKRIPIALTPFGVLLYYRKLTGTDEDVAFIDPVSRATDELAWSLDDFFNRFLCREASLAGLIPPALVQSARRECGPLAPGEVYEVDQLLLSMQMLKVTKADALGMHRSLRDAVDPPKPRGGKPVAVADALPAQYLPLFADIAIAPGLTGLYLSSYIDWHRLLALQPDGQYRLLFWRIHHQSFERAEIRAYNGAYTLSRNADGDDTLALDIALRQDSLGSDANDDRLVAMQSQGTIFLLRDDRLEDMASAINDDGEMGRSEHYFRRVTLEEAFINEPSDGRAALPLADLPQALQALIQALIQAGPLITTITHVDEPDLDEEDQGEGTVMCTLDLGEADGLRMNMPLYSPDESGRHLKGWVWDMAPHACRAGIQYRRAADGSIAHGPVAGDVLTSRAPGR